MVKVKEQEITPNKMVQVLDWSYDKVQNGLPNSLSAEELGEDYLSRFSTVDEAIDSLIKWQISKTATTGFASSVGGAFTLPAVPASIASTVYIHMRMIAAIAHMRGFNIRSDQVKTMVYLSFLGEAVNNVLKDYAIDITKKVLIAQLKKLSPEILKAINKKVGFRLVAKNGKNASISLVKLIPIVGGVVGATFNGVSTVSIGKTAKKLFIENPEA